MGAQASRSSQRTRNHSTKSAKGAKGASSKTQPDSSSHIHIESDDAVLSLSRLRLLNPSPKELEFAVDQLFILCQSGNESTLRPLLDNYPILFHIMTESYREYRVKDISMQMTVFMAAAASGHAGIIQTLMSYSQLEISNFQSKDRFGNTALHIAILARNFKCVQTLCKDPRIEVNILNNCQLTPLVLAVQLEFISCVHYLLERKDLDVSIQDNNGNTALHIAALRSHLDIMVALTCRPPASGTTRGSTPQTQALTRAVKSAAADSCKATLPDSLVITVPEDEKDPCPTSPPSPIMEFYYEMENKDGMSVHAILLEQVDATEQTLSFSHREGYAQAKETHLKAVNCLHYYERAVLGIDPAYAAKSSSTVFGSPAPSPQRAQASPRLPATTSTSPRATTSSPGNNSRQPRRASTGMYGVSQHPIVIEDVPTGNDGGSGDDDELGEDDDDATSFKAAFSWSPHNEQRLNKSRQFSSPFLH